MSRPLEHLERLERAEHTEHAAYVEHTERSAPTEHTAHIARTEHSAPTEPSAHTEYAAHTAHIERIERAERAEHTEQAEHIERTEHSAQKECAAHTAPTEPIEPADPAPLLHNMSAPPKTVVTYTGLSGLAKQSGPGGSGTSAVAVRGADVFGLPLCFALPAAFTADTPEAVLAEVYAQAREHGAGDARDLVAPTSDAAFAELERLVDARAAELPLPDGCLVVPADDTHAMPWPDLLAALAVLAKCSDTVWLRAKTPSLTAALARRRASLLVPPRFAHALRLPGAPPMPAG